MEPVGRKRPVRIYYYLHIRTWSVPLIHQNEARRTSTDDRKRHLGKGALWPHQRGLIEAPPLRSMYTPSLDEGGNLEGNGTRRRHSRGGEGEMTACR